MLVTCGSGGAFLHPTHTLNVTEPKVMDRAQETGAITPDLRNRTRVGTQDSAPSETQRAYHKNASYPDKETSKDLSRGNLRALFKPISTTSSYSGDSSVGHFQRFTDKCERLFAGNIMLPISLGFLYWVAVLCNSFVFSDAFSNSGFNTTSEIPSLELHCFLLQWFKAFFFSPLALVIHLVIFFVCFSIALEDEKKSAIPGAIHGFLQVLAIPTLYWLIGKFLAWPFISEIHISHYVLHLNNDYLKGFLFFLGAIFVSGGLFGLFFFIMSNAGLLANNAFSTLAHQGYKGFLRFRIDTEGNLHGYMIGTDSVPQDWVINPAKEQPVWIEKNPADAPKWKVRDVFSLSK
jgi:hypothetical protein